MITGYQRQHRKDITYDASAGGDPQTTDQYTRIMKHVTHTGAINEIFSKACELATISGMVMLQPYLDFGGQDPAQGQLKMKVWEYNAFLVDPYFREPDMSDAQFFWAQEYISKKEAEDRFPGKLETIAPMAGTPQRYGSFYFLPENYNMARNDLMVLSYIWYKWKRKKKKLYSKSRNQFFDFSEEQADLDAILYNIPDMEVVEVEVPTWKLAVVLNDQLMYQGDNPLGFDECPIIPVFWNYEPHQTYYDLRARSLIKTMRDPQFLMNRRIIINHDITEATINQGWKRKVGAVGNEDNLKKSGQGWDIIINEGYELSDCEKILPSGVPESDLALSEQLNQLIWSTSGVNIENWSAQQDPNASSLTVLMKQAANLMVLQKYFDQWDYSLQLVGDKMLKIILNNWNESKCQLILGEDPSPYFYSKIFSNYQVVVQEGLNTATQKNMQAQQLLDINKLFGREVFPPSMIVKDMNLSGKAEAVKYLQEQEEQLNAKTEHQEMVASTFEEAKLKEMYARATNLIATARERHSRSDSNVGLFEERLSEVAKNEALSTKAKMEAIEKMVDVIAKYGEIETTLAESKLQSYDIAQDMEQDREKAEAKQMSSGNEFLTQAFKGLSPGLQQRNQQAESPPNQEAMMAQLLNNRERQ